MFPTKVIRANVGGGHIGSVGKFINDSQRNLLLQGTALVASIGLLSWWTIKKSAHVKQRAAAAKVDSSKMQAEEY